MKKSLFETNLYLRDPEKYRESLVANVASSTAIETGADVEDLKKKISPYADEYLRSPEAKPNWKSR